MAEVKAVALGEMIRQEGDISSRAGQMDRLYHLGDLVDTLTADRDAARAECERLRTLCGDMLPVFEAARPLVLNLERLRDATRGEK